MPCGAQLLGKSADIALGNRQRFCRGGVRVEAVLDGFQLRACLRRPGEQLVVRLRAKATLGVRNSVETGLDLFEPSRLGLECRQEATKLTCGLAQAQLHVAQLVTGSGKLWRKLLERRECTLGAPDETGCTFAFFGSERLAASAAPSASSVT